MTKQTEKTDKTSAAATPRVLEVTSEGNIETTRRPNGTVIVNSVAVAPKKKGD